MLNGMAYGAGAGLASSLITEAGYQLQLKNSKSPAISADMAEVISSNTNDIVRRLDVSYMDYNYWDSSAPSMFKDYIQYFNDIWSSNVSSSPTPNVPSSTVINPVFFPY
jgi:outer membrane receptor for ferric coprogen and ferric-rhodotorulic acid